MKQFNLEEYLADPTQKVITRNGRAVEMISTKGRKPYRVLGYIGNNEGISTWCDDGRFFNHAAIKEHICDIFFADEESEDERIRKELIEAIEKGRVFDIDKEVADRWIAWLEKQKDKDCLACDQHLKGYLAGRKVTKEEEQKEQKPAEWSEEAEEDIQEASEYLRDYANKCVQGGNSKLYIQSLADRIESLRLRPKQDVFPSLSDKEIICLKRTLDYLRKEHNRYEGEDFTNEIVVLEGLITRPILVSDPHWKPSEEQMEMLSYVVEVRSDLCGDVLRSLYQDLKKLMKE